MTTEIGASWYNQLLEDLRDLIVETEFTSRWALIEGYHAVGTRILAENDNFERAKIYGQDITQRIATSLGKSERTVNYAIKFAQMYPDLNLLAEGKNISWHHIINKYLTTGEKRVIISKSDLMQQITEIKKLLQTEYVKELQLVNNGELAINKSNLEFIRYLQDQVNKITGGIQ